MMQNIRSIAKAAAMIAAVVSPSAAAQEQLSACADYLAEAHDSGDELIIGAPFAPEAIIDGMGLIAPLHLQQVLDANQAPLIVIDGGHFAGWDFASVQFNVPVCIYRADLQGSNWRGADANGFAFIETVLANADFGDARLARIWIENSDLENTDMRGADLSGGRLSGDWWTGNLQNWNLNGANLSDFRFICGGGLDDGCPLETAGLSMDNAVLEGADISRLRLPHDFTAEDAILGQTHIAPDQFLAFSSARALDDIFVRGGQDFVTITARDFHFVTNEVWRANAQRSGPAFNCDNAQTRVERLICSPDGYELRWRDLQMSDFFTLLVAVDPTELVMQREWLASRDECQSTTCLLAHYRQRVEDLRIVTSTIDWVEPGQTQIFVAPAPDFGPELEASPLYAQLAPALVAESDAWAVLRRRLDGGYDIYAQSFGGNGHVCHAFAHNLRRRGNRPEEAGWLSFARRGEEGDLPAQEDGRIARYDGLALHIFESGKPSLRHYPQSASAISCGARAVIPPLYPLMLEQEQAEALARNLVRDL